MKKEKYISEYDRNGVTYFRVRAKGVSRTFSEIDYFGKNKAFKRAIEFRNQLVYLNINESRKTVNDCYMMIQDIYSLRYETIRKLDIIYGKYITTKNKPISEVTRADILQDLNRMVDKPNDTIQRALSIYRKIFDVAISYNYISNDITNGIKPPKSHKIAQNERINMTSEEDIVKLGEYIKKSVRSSHEKRQLPLMLKMLLYTGMRPAELFALENKDIDLKKKTIRIHQEVGSSRDENKTIRQCKTELSNRTIPISNKCMPIVKELLNKDRYLLVDKNGALYDSTSIGNRIHLLAKSNGQDFHLYQCRFTYITTLFMKGVDIKTIQMLVGQKIDATTLGYVVTNEKRMEDATNLM